MRDCYSIAVDSDDGFIFGSKPAAFYFAYFDLTELGKQHCQEKVTDLKTCGNVEMTRWSILNNELKQHLQKQVPRITCEMESSTGVWFLGEEVWLLSGFLMEGLFFQGSELGE